MITTTITDPMASAPYVVREVTKETPDTFTLTLEPENGATGTLFQPGQFSMLWVFGGGELPISISGEPGSGTSGVHGPFRRPGDTGAGEPETWRRYRRSRSLRHRLADRGRPRHGRRPGRRRHRVGAACVQ